VRRNLVQEFPRERQHRGKREGGKKEIRRKIGQISFFGGTGKARKKARGTLHVTIYEKFLVEEIRYPPGDPGKRMKK